jgi:hypothetical protein
MILHDFPISDFGVYQDIRGPKPFDIYAVDPVTGDARKIDMRGKLGHPSIAEFFIDSAASSILVQTTDYTDDGTPRPVGGSIQRIDLASGEWRLLLDAGSEVAYSLLGATPGGGEFLYTRQQMTSAGMETKHFVQNAATGHKTEIAIGSTLNQLWLSPSGEYVAAFDLIRSNKLLIIRVDSGEMRDIAWKTREGIPLPMGFLGGLSANN